MAHICYPQHEHVQFHGRSEDALQSLPSWEADRQEQLERRRVRQESGWASDLREEYRPLGPPVELPPLGAQLRMKKLGSNHYRRPKIVTPEDPEEERPHQAEEKVVVRPLATGVLLREQHVRQHEYNYNSFELRERKVLVFTLETTRGDADIFVSNDARNPSQDEHTWRSAVQCCTCTGT